MDGISLKKKNPDGERLPSSPKIWTTADEIDYLSKLGTNGRVKNGLNRLKLLEMYRDSMKLRAYWGNVNPVAVATAVDWMINAERQALRETKDGPPDAA